MKLYGIRLLVSDFPACFRFYSETLGLKHLWGKPDGDYADFDLGQGVSLGLYKSDLMADVLGNRDKNQPEGLREKDMVILMTENVDAEYQRLKARGVTFINAPKDMTAWGIRTVHFRDPEGNLFELCAELSRDKWDRDLIEEDNDYRK